MRTIKFKSCRLKPIQVQENQPKSNLSSFLWVPGSPLSFFSLEIQGSAVMCKKNPVQGESKFEELYESDCEGKTNRAKFDPSVWVSSQIKELHQRIHKKLVIPIAYGIYERDGHTS